MSTCFAEGKTLARLSRLAGAAVLFALAAGCCPKPPNLLGVLLIAGQQDGEHGIDLSRLAERLTGRGEIAVEVARDFSVLEGPALARYRVLVFAKSTQTDLSTAARQAVLDHVRSGGGLVAMNGALSGCPSWPEWVELVGGATTGRDGDGPCDCVSLDLQHAAVMGMGGRFAIPDAPGLVAHLDPAAEVLVRTAQPCHGPDGRPREHPDPQVWTKRTGDGRVIALAFGHDPRALDDEWFITLLHNAVRWAGGDLPDTGHNTLTPAERQEGYELLFNGQDLSGWPDGTANWTVEHGELVGRADQLAADGFLIGAGTYGDFVLRCSVKLSGGQGNSGIILRCGRLPEGVVLGYELDVAAGRYGTIYEEGGTRGVLAEGWKDKGEHVALLDGWNEVAVRAVGGKITLVLNGLTTAEYQATAADAQPASGSIALELHRNMRMEVRFRDMRIKRM